MAENHGSESIDRPGESCTEEVERLRRRVAELERREAEHRQKEQVPEQSEERFRLFYEQSPLGYQSLDADGRILEVNPAWLKILGYERKEVVGRWFGDFLTPDSRRVFPDRFARFKEVGEVHDVRFEMVCGDGRIRCIEFDGRISRTPEGYFDRTHCVLRDVTERKETEEAIRRNEAKYRLFVETTNEGIWAMDADHKTTFVNARMAAMLGYTEEEMIGRVVEEFMFEEDLPAHRERMAARHEGKAARYEHRFRRKDGGEVWTLVSATALMSSQGRFEGSFALFADITERKRTEEALRRSEERFRAIFKGAAAMVAVADTSGRWTHVNQYMADLLGYSVGELTGMRALDITHPDDRPEAQALLGRLLKGEIPSYRMERRHIRKDGGVVWVDLSVSPLHGDQGQVEGLIEVAFDITVLKESEEALIDNSRRLAETIRAGNIGLWDWDLATNRVRYSAEWKRQIGYEEDEIGDGFEEWESRVHPNDLGPTLARIREAIADASVRYQVEFRFRHKDGTYRWILAQSSVFCDKEGHPNRVLGSHIDITDRKRAEERLLLTSQMLDAAPSSITVHDFQGRFLYANAKTFEIHGYSRDEFMAINLHDLDVPESESLIAERMQEIAARGEASFEVSHRRKDGSSFPLEVNVKQVVWDGVPAMLSVATDITERKHAQEAVENQRAELEAIYESAPVMMCVLESDRRVLYANRAFTEFTGCSQEQLKAGRACGVFGCINALSDPRGCGYGRDCEHCAIRLAMEDTFQSGMGHRDIEYHATLERHGARREVVLLGATARIEREGRYNLLLCLQDITDRKRAETRLQQTTKLLRAIRDAQSLYIAGAEIKQVYNALLQTLVTMTDSEFGFLDEVLRDEAGQLYKRSLAISDISWDEDSRKLYRQLAERNFEFRNLNNLAGLPATTDSLVISNTPDQDPRSGGVPKGHPSLRTFMGVPMHFGGRVVGVAGVANRPGGYDAQIAEFLEPFVVTCAGIIQAAQNDAKERQYQQSLRQSHTNLLAIIESTEDLIASRDREGRLIFCNSAFSRMIERLFQVQAKPGLRTLDFLPPAKRQYWQNVFRRVLEGEIFRGEIEYDVDGELRFYDVSFHPIVQDHQIIGTVEFTRDVTEPHRIRKQAQQRQQELLRVSRLSTLGEMASGIAHELNQPLTAILSYGEACRRRIQAESPDFALINEYLEQIISQGQRAGLIIRRMRAMAKGQQTQFISANLQEIIEAAVGMIRWELAQNEIAVCVDIAESLPPAYVDPIQIEQVLLNLIRNSMDAMGAVPPEQRSLTVRATVWDNDYLNVEVCDSGIGLPPPDQGSVFEPFFTTKPDGLGIGLSISRSIIEAHRGTLEARSNPGPGATFFFRLPIYRPTGD
ncbi:MAG: PAS domain S-box protein [Phycisphaerae bacterium]|nr:PAS domain S-box protein [Phycisphaerae bacterium]